MLFSSWLGTYGKPEAISTAMRERALQQDRAVPRGQNRLHTPSSKMRVIGRNWRKWWIESNKACFVIALRLPEGDNNWHGTTIRGAMVMAVSGSDTGFGLPWALEIDGFWLVIKIYNVFSGVWDIFCMFENI